MTPDLKFRLNSLLLVLLIGIEIGIVTGSLLRRYTTNGPFIAVCLVAAAAVGSLWLLLKWIEEP